MTALDLQKYMKRNNLSAMTMSGAFGVSRGYIDSLLDGEAVFRTNLQYAMGWYERHGHQKVLLSSFNLKRFLNNTGVGRNELAAELGVRDALVHDWANADRPIDALNSMAIRQLASQTPFEPEVRLANGTHDILGQRIHHRSLT